MTSFVLVSLLVTLEEIPGETTYASSVGVMGTTVDALRLVLSAILSTQPWIRDPVVAPIPWRNQIIEETLARCEAGRAPLKLGIFWTDEWVTPHPPVQRALRVVVDAVTGAGHKVCSSLGAHKFIAT